MKESLQPSELRIGNLLQDKVTKTVLKVTGLNENNIETYVIDRSKFPLQTGWGLEPIPLTAEWLLKFGLQYQENYRQYKCSDAPIYFINHPGNENDLVCFLHQCSCGNIKYVHQLQNLYLSITMRELKNTD